MSKIAAWLGACALLLLAGCHEPPPHTAAGPGAGENWASHGGAADETDYSRLAEITNANVGRLGLAASLDLPGETTLEATPVAVGGVLYFTGALGKVYAADGATGALLWTYDPEVWKHNPDKMRDMFAANRGVAYDAGKVFSASLDGRLFALDAKTGKLLWSVETVPHESMQYVTGAPRAFGGKVIIGQGGADFGLRGYVTAYDQATGKQAWRFYVVPGSPQDNQGDPAMEKAAATWSGEFWKVGTGGGPWDSLTFDPELNRIYVGTANAAPNDPQVRSPGGGDNLYTASIVALDAGTGKYLWHYQTTPRDSWDYDSTQQMTLADLAIDGKPRKVLMQAPKNGFLYVLDRTDGKLISAGKIGKVTWADHIDLATGRPVEAKNIRYETGESTVWPSATGAHSWQSMSFSPKTGLVYIPYMQIGIRFAKGAPQRGDVSVGGLNMGSVIADPQDGKGALLAWDPVRQQAAWRVQLDTLANGGTLATAGGLTFQGDANGAFNAYDAASGRPLWRYDAGLGIIAAPISYAVKGRQYVAVLVGYGGSAGMGSDHMHVGWKYGAQPRRLLIFALDGKATLPASPARDMTVHAVDDPKLQLNAADVEAGHALYMACALCHGRDLQSVGAPGPDLRESQAALDPQSFYHIVHDGPLLAQGMPRFDNLTRQQILQIWAYVRAGAREAKTAQPNAAAQALQEANPAPAQLPQLGKGRLPGQQ